MQSILGAILEDFPSAAAPAAPPPLPPLSYTWQTLPIAIFELCSAPTLYMLSAHHHNAAALQINTIRQCSVFFFLQLPFLVQILLLLLLLLPQERDCIETKCTAST
jgi:hypothetical protein